MKNVSIISRLKILLEKLLKNYLKVKKPLENIFFDLFEFLLKKCQNHLNKLLN